MQLKVYERPNKKEVRKAINDTGNECEWINGSNRKKVHF